MAASQWKHPTFCKSRVHPGKSSKNEKRCLLKLHRTLESKLLSEFFNSEFFFNFHGFFPTEKAPNFHDLDLNHVTRTNDILEKLKNKIRNDQILFHNCPKHTQRKKSPWNKVGFANTTIFRHQKGLWFWWRCFSNLSVNQFPPLDILVKTTFPAFIFFYYSCYHQFRKSKHILWLFNLLV